jgi:hypothetical protein
VKGVASCQLGIFFLNGESVTARAARLLLFVDIGEVADLKIRGLLSALGYILKLNEGIVLFSI